MAKAHAAPTTSSLQRQLPGVDTLFYVAVSLVIAASIAGVFLR